MKNKKKLYMILGSVGIILLGVMIYIGVTIFPKLQTGKEIADALQPVLEAENQTMHLDVAADINGEQLTLDTDAYLVKDGDTKYLVLEQDEYSLYVVDNILFLENGKAFKIADEMQSQVKEYKNLLPQIMAVYEMFEITKNKTDIETSYEITVTGEQVENLLAVAMPTENAGLKDIETLQVKLVTKEKQLDRVEISGNANVDSTSVQVDVTISEFQVLNEGEYVIPELIKESLATVDKDSLFSLTEDLYRFIVAFEQFSGQENKDGTVTLSANCGIINFNQMYNLKDLENSEIDSVDTEDIRNLPAMIGFLCMEGDISCTEVNTGYEYKLALDEESMQKIAEMVVPELINYVVNMTEGTVVVMLENDRIASIEISVEGSIKVLFSEVPAKVGADFIFE